MPAQVTLQTLMPGHPTQYSDGAGDTLAVCGCHWHVDRQPSAGALPTGICDPSFLRPDVVPWAKGLRPGDPEPLTMCSRNSGRCGAEKEELS